MKASTRETIGDYIALDWYDGPLLEIARVDFTDRDCLVQVQALCTVHNVETPPSELSRGTVSGERPWQRAVVRFSRADLQAMLDLLDGKPVKDYNER